MTKALFIAPILSYNNGMEGCAIEPAFDALRDGPIIAAVRDVAALDRALASPVRIVFLLGGDVFGLPSQVQRAQRAGKRVYVHLDLVDGFSRAAAGVRMAARLLRPNGILSTRAPLVRAASEEGLHTVLRIFMVDSSSYETGERMIKSGNPGMIEVMPGLVSRAILRLRARIAQPVIAGGMMEDAQDVRAALNAGAAAVSTSSEALWQSDWETNGAG